MVASVLERWPLDTTYPGFMAPTTLVASNMARPSLLPPPLLLAVQTATPNRTTSVIPTHTTTHTAALTATPPEESSPKHSLVSLLCTQRMYTGYPTIQTNTAASKPLHMTEKITVAASFFSTEKPVTGLDASIHEWPVRKP
ncbi:hypothetical protein EPUS_00062 [Endocarpon pusillum Z07020]|uniref:Uncharacterized protein n=1 Tax=Endocarpon pusillum (strain Z07020 / HMAS-L-300199) TaxID=1263415 RepID=U1HWV9_ENDPU|nr:uncharacterized protein EPUS_00062 [Endocarpon pusillum Z07020]ERF75270.1 hypothetical protein EPUS_00062 [Endocarpon pusillum Z07020]